MIAENRKDRFTSQPEDFEIVDVNADNGIRIGRVRFVPIDAIGFTYEAYRDDLPNEVLAWVYNESDGIEVHTAVSIETYPTLEAAASAIENYK